MLDKMELEIMKVDAKNGRKEKLIELFQQWKKAHGADSWFEKTCIKGKESDDNFKKSFIPDGCVDFEKYNNANKKVLFILKEPASNGKEEEYNGISPISDLMKTHWYKLLIENEGNIKFNNEKTNRSKCYYNKFKIICDMLHVVPKETAFMNINKRGGYSKGTNDKMLSNYLEVYEDFVRKEIEILEPDVIVSCIGNGILKDKLYDENSIQQIVATINNKKRDLFIAKYNKKTKVYGMYHPGCMLGYCNYKCLFENIIAGKKN